MKQEDRALVKMGEIREKQKKKEVCGGDSPGRNRRRKTQKNTFNLGKAESKYQK